MARGTAFSTIPIANLISGVSQQPPTLRLSTALDEMINAWPSVATGLNKRPPTEHLAKVDIDATSGMFGYLIDRDANYNFLVTVSKDTLKVFSLNGVEQTVNFPNGKSYLNQSINPVSDFRAVTLGDTTFLLNRQVSVVSDEYGEEGYTSIAGAITVANKSDIPATAPYGTIYKVTSENKFYQYTHHNNSPPTYGWVRSGGESINDGGGYPQGGSLPAPPVALNQNFWIHWITVVSSGYVTHHYQKYISAITNPPGPAYDSWDEVRPIDIGVPPPDAKRFDPATQGTVYITQAIANVYYSVYLNGNLVGQVRTPNGTDAANSVPGTDQIASTLAQDIQTRTPALLPGLQIIGSTLSFSGLQKTDRLEVRTTNGDKAVKCYKDTIDNFNNLPPNERENRIVMVQGDLESNGDDYYVIFQGGKWVETYGFGQGAKPLANSMPHVLVREADNTWTFKQWHWNSRGAGSKDSNKNPSFVGFSMNDIFLYTNRLCFLADENIIMSEAGAYENFYRTTLATLIDSDPIDIAVMNNGVDKLYHAVPFNKDLLLMSDRNQYRLNYTNFLGPKNLTVQFTTSFTVSPTIKPSSIAGSIYFVDDKPGYNYARLWEYFPKDNFTGDDADDTTASIPEYIKAGTEFMSASVRLKTVLLNSANQPNTLFLYKFYWGGQTKIQNAWGKWIFPGVQKVIWAGFSFNYIYLLLKRNDGVYLERIKVEESVSRSDSVTRYLIDRQVSEAQVLRSYNSVTNKTLITIPYPVTGNVEIVSYNDNVNAENRYVDLRHVVNKISDTTFEVNDNITNVTGVRVGIPYTKRIRFSTPYIRQAKGNGEIVVLDAARLQMRYMTVQYNQSVNFKARVSYPDRQDAITEWDGRTVGDPRARFGEDPALSGIARIPLLGNNKDMTLELINDCPWNTQFSSAEWSFFFSLTAKNRM